MLFKLFISTLLLVVLLISFSFSKQQSSSFLLSNLSFVDWIEKNPKQQTNSTKTIKTSFDISSFTSSTLNVSETLRPSFNQSSEHFVEDLEEDSPYIKCSVPTNGDSLWKFSIPYLNKSLGLLQFDKYRGKPLLLVNVATFCESTIEYPMYNELKDKYEDEIHIIAFPSAQFLNQEPTADPTELYNAIKYVRPGNGFIPKFPLTERIDVNGENQHPIYNFLKRCCPSTRKRFTTKEANLLYNPKNSRDIRWNFEKFLIHPLSGYPLMRYDQKYLPNKIVSDIDRLLEEMKQTSN